MQLLDLSWFRTECHHTLRTRLGPGLHCRDCFDLASKYLLALKTVYYFDCFDLASKYLLALKTVYYLKTF